MNFIKRQTVDDTVISGLCWLASDRYRLLITVGGVSCIGGDFSQTGRRVLSAEVQDVGVLTGKKQEINSRKKVRVNG